MPVSRKFLALAGAAALGLQAVAGADVVNIDLNGQRDGETSPGTYVGLGAVGTGTVFNGVLVDSNTPAPNNGNITVAAAGLLDQNGVPTTVGFGIATVGGDTNGGDILNDDYAFNNSANNSSPAGSALTITGLGGTTADVYLFLEAGSGGATVGGQSGTNLGTVNGIPNVFLFNDVPVAGGTVTGIFSAGGTGILNGLTVDFTAVPEPASLGLCALERFPPARSVYRRAGFHSAAENKVNLYARSRVTRYERL